MIIIKIYTLFRKFKNDKNFIYKDAISSGVVTDVGILVFQYDKTT